MGFLTKFKMTKKFLKTKEKFSLKCKLKNYQFKFFSGKDLFSLFIK